MNKENKTIQQKLFDLQDLKYRDFQCRLMPTVDPNTVIGVRTPKLRTFAKGLTSDDVREFLSVLPHRYYEENNLHGFLISAIKDYDAVIEELDRFLPYVDNWATCDSIRPAAFKKHPKGLVLKIKQWVDSNHEYTVRFGIEMLMTYYLDDEFLPEYLDIAANVKTDEYYVKMMVAWFFATALAKQYSPALPYIERRVLDKWTHNKAIQKAIESYRVNDEQKAYLRTLKF